MNYNDVKEYITKEWERKIYYELPQNHEVVKDLFEVFGNEKQDDWKEIELYLKKKAPNQQFFLDGIHSSGDVRTKYIVKDRYKEAIIIHIEYKSVTLQFDFLKTGECYNAYHMFSIYELDSFGRSSHHEISKSETLEEYYEKYLEDVKISKRKYMTYYNKEIRNIKQEYKNQLKQHNDILKRSD